MKKIGIVILNYRNFQDTIECVESLFGQKDCSYRAVIVDNASPNESFAVLKEKYGSHPDIDVIQTSGNLGYAKGNNVGIRHLKENYQLYNILVINNDVIFTDEHYLQFLQQYDSGTAIGAVGTKIIGSDGLNQNPRYDSVKTKRVLKDVVYFSLDEYGMIAYYRKLKGRLKKEGTPAASPASRPQQGDYFLHGSAIFLTENYLKEVDGFYPKTFLYYEENILAIVMEKMGLRMQYDGEKAIYHKEDQSSAMSFDNVKKAFAKYLAQSIRIAARVRFMKVEAIKKVINQARY